MVMEKDSVDATGVAGGFSRRAGPFAPWPGIFQDDLFGTLFSVSGRGGKDMATVRIEKCGKNWSRP